MSEKGRDDSDSGGSESFTPAIEALLRLRRVRVLVCKKYTGARRQHSQCDTRAHSRQPHARYFYRRLYPISSVGPPELSARDGPRVAAVSSHEMCERRKEQSPPYIVDGAARQEITFDILVVDSAQAAQWALRPRDTAQCCLCSF